MIIDGCIHDFVLVNQLVHLQQRESLGVDAVVVHCQATTCHVIPDAEIPLEVLEQVLDGRRGQALLDIAFDFDASLKK